MLWAIPFLVCCTAGFMLFRKRTIPPLNVSAYHGAVADKRKLSVIIPARNEERNLPELLQSLKRQTRPPDEIIVVDDFSTDRTKEVAARFDGVTVLANKPLPPGWTGKNWAVWNGYAISSGELIAFLDADVRLAPDALASLIAARDQTSGVVSVVPYHITEHWHERLALVTNILGVFAFMSRWEERNRKQGLYGSCILTMREHYEAVQGHASVKAEVLDDLSLGARYKEAGIPVTNYIGKGLVNFRMYAQGLRSGIEGFGKSAALSTATLHPVTIILNAMWVVGLLVSEFVWLAIGTGWVLPLAIGYGLYMVQMIYLIKYIGRFGWAIVPLHLLSGMFFLVMMAYSAYQVVLLGRVKWKGRDVKTGG